MVLKALSKNSAALGGKQYKCRINKTNSTSLANEQEKEQHTGQFHQPLEFINHQLFH